MGSRAPYDLNFGTENELRLGLTQGWSGLTWVWLNLTNFDPGFYLATIIWKNDFGPRLNVIYSNKIKCNIFRLKYQTFINYIKYQG